ncbi:hypothetical protein L1887_36325 [Cichorium endivia]|nr:hypothetical protein L1887_36325 [Cichorium endivia]
MYWWQSSPAPSSSRSHSSSKSFDNNKNDGDAPPFAVRGRRVSYGTVQLNPLAGGRKLRNFTDDDVGHRSPLSTVIAHPLPLPYLAVLLKRDSGLERSSSDPTSKYILPLPEALTRAGENKIISHTNRVDWQGSRRSPTSIKSNTPIGPPTATAETPLVHPLPLPPGIFSPVSSSPPRINFKPESIPILKQNQWRKGKLIGRGTFGSVYVGSNRETGALCAMKEVEICRDDPKSAECIKQLEQEINVLSQLKHPNIVQYYGSEIVGDRFYIYLEYVHPGSINKYARDHCGGMTESIVRNFTRHIVNGLAYLHGTKTIHRDIKGANLLVDANGVVKLADFGMAKHLNAKASHLSLKGSPYWMAPELLQCGMQKDASPDVGLAIDIWSLGCTIIEMINGKPPWSEYEGHAAMFKVMKETPPIPETMSSEGKDFLRCCFIRNPAERPSATTLLQHSFMLKALIMEWDLGSLSIIYVLASAIYFVHAICIMEKDIGCPRDYSNSMHASIGAFKIDNIAKQLQSDALLIAISLNRERSSYAPSSTGIYIGFLIIKSP